MKSKSTNVILGIVILVVVAIVLYFFVFRKDNAQPTSGLTSVTTGQQKSSVVASSSSTGNQVVEILRNLTAIKLDDAVFRNPALNQLSDMRVIIPQATDQGRRNPFAAFGIN